MVKEKNTEPRVSCFTCQMRNHSEWSVLTLRELEFLDSKKVCRQYARGEFVFHEGDPCRGIYCVERGLVGIRKADAEGNSVLLGQLAESGSTLGYRPLLAGENHRAGAEVLKESTICFIDKSSVWELIGHNPNLGVQFLRVASKALGEAEEEILKLITLDLRTRLVHLLLIFIKHYGTILESGAVMLELPLSRPDMAAM